MHKGLTYGGKRIFGIVICALLTIAFFYMFVNSDQLITHLKTTDQDQTITGSSEVTAQTISDEIDVEEAMGGINSQSLEKAEKSESQRIVGTSEIVMLSIALLLILFIYFVLLYVPSIPDIMAKPIGALLPALYAFKKTGDEIWPTIIFLSTCLSFAVLLFFVNGHIKDSKVYLKRIRNKIMELQDEEDWLQQDKNDYPIRVVRINTIPNDLNSILSMDYANLASQVKKFCRGTIKKRKGKKCVLLVGDFGSGKSTAILNCAYSKIRNIFIYPNAIPLYIKLTDLFSEDAVSDLQRYKAWEAGKSQEYLDKLRKKVYTLYCSDKTAEKNKEYFPELYEEDRLIFIFDGLNEVLQSEYNEEAIDGMNKTILANRIFEVLWKMVGGNRFILTTCTYPDVITHQMLRSHEKDTEIYAIKGIDLSRNETENQWEKEHQYETLFNSSATFYSLRKENQEKKITPYRLLMRYVEKVNPDLEGKIDKELRIIKEKICEIKEKPYSTFHIDQNDCRSSLYDSPMFRMKIRKSDREDEVELAVCHVLVLEFLLSYYAKCYLRRGEDKQFIELFCEPDQFDKSEHSEQSKQPDLLILKHPHIADAFKMLITDEYVYYNENAISLIETIIPKLYSCLGEDRNSKLKFLLLLSRIKDEIELYCQNKEITFGLSTETIKDVAEMNGLSTFVQFQLYKLCPDTAMVNDNLERLAFDAMKQRWTHLGIKRQILRYFFLKKDRWPMIEGYPSFSGSMDLPQCPHKPNCVTVDECDNIIKPKQFDKALKKYFMQEYPAELRQLDKTIKPLSIGNDSWAHIHSFFRTRIREIRFTTNGLYALVVLLLSIQIAVGIWNSCVHWPALVIKVIGLILGIGSWWAWIKQLWKNEEYYGLALGDYSRDEPIYQVLKVVFGKRNTDEEENVETVVGDWLKNRPSILFLLVSSISVIYTHHFFQHWGIYEHEAVLLECGLSLLIYFTCCIPKSTWKYIREIRRSKTKGRLLIYSIMILLFLVIFMLPIAATTIGEMQWGMGAGIGFSALGFILFIIIWFFLIRKAEGSRKTDKSCCPTPTWKRIICFVVFIILFITPGYLLSTILPEDKTWAKQLGAAISLFLVAASVYFSLCYASFARMARKEREDDLLLNNKSRKMEKIEAMYSTLSCSGQIKLLNKLLNDKKTQTKGLRMKKFMGLAKTPQVLDMLLDAEIHNTMKRKKLKRISAPVGKFYVYSR